MNLRELVDELRSNILRDTSTSVAAPTEDEQLWSDTTLVRYIDDGYFKFARKSLCLRDDSTAAVTQIPLAEGVGTYDLHASVLSVYSVTLSDGAPLTRSKNPTLFFSASNTALATTPALPWRPGKPVLYATDSAVRKLAVREVPSAEYGTDTLYMRVARLPLEHLTMDDLDAVPEIDDDYHLDILEWAAYRALRNHDTDAENMQKANSHKAQFERTVDALIADARRQMFQPIQFETNTDWR